MKESEGGRGDRKKKRKGEKPPRHPSPCGFSQGLSLSCDHSPTPFPFDWQEVKIHPTPPHRTPEEAGCSLRWPVRCRWEKIPSWASDHSSRTNLKCKSTRRRLSVVSSLSVGARAAHPANGEAGVASWTCEWAQDPGENAPPQTPPTAPGPRAF